MEATIDPERARGHTVASNAAADEAGAERIMRERQTGRSFVNYGYSENQVRSFFGVFLGGMCLYLGGEVTDGGAATL